MRLFHLLIEASFLFCNGKLLKLLTQHTTSWFTYLLSTEQRVFSAMPTFSCKPCKNMNNLNAENNMKVFGSTIHTVLNTALSTKI